MMPKEKIPASFSQHKKTSGLMKANKFGNKKDQAE